MLEFKFGFDTKGLKAGATFIPKRVKNSMLMDYDINQLNADALRKF
jgi:hypothetical protein